MRGILQYWVYRQIISWQIHIRITYRLKARACRCQKETPKSPVYHTYLIVSNQLNFAMFCVQNCLVFSSNSLVLYYVCLNLLLYISVTHNDYWKFFLLFILDTFLYGRTIFSWNTYRLTTKRCKYNILWPLLSFYVTDI